ncbi:Ankyrin repeat-rich membrane-spanning-like protein [Cladobotryum mycophilum]|uniref:Ankyrin repeat-rich membrane-spanning-like protein n=1 Tax=Cladobotryum mycophilum TaxID=491253 RepID=A0ABR0T1R2_9HYPO
MSGLGSPNLADARRGSAHFLLPERTAGDLTIDTQHIGGDARVHNGDVMNVFQSPVSPPRRNSQWASYTPFNQPHKTIQDKAKISSQLDFCKGGRYPGQWLLESDTFKQWKSPNPPSRKLWYHGMPGAGKSVLASIIIEHLLLLQNGLETPQSSTERPAVAYLYLSHASQSSVEEILSCLIKQIVVDTSQISEQAQEFWKHYNGGIARVEAHALANLLDALVQERRTYIVVDGLDEFDQQRRDQLLGHLQLDSLNLRILFMSRRFANFSSVSTEFTVEAIHAQAADVDLFIDHEFAKQSQLAAASKTNPSLKEIVKSEIKDEFRGMFSFVYCYMQKQAGESTPIQIRKNSWDDCGVLSDLYSGALGRIKKKTGKKGPYRFARETLFWVAFCPSPLTIEELKHAVDNPKNNDMKEVIEDVCSELLTVVDGRVTFVHDTARYSLRTIATRSFNATIARKCIQSLSPPMLEELGNKHYSEWHASPLVDYAAHYFGYHLRNMGQRPDQPEMVTELADLLQSRQRRIFLFRSLYRSSGMPESRTSFDGNGDDETANKREMTAMHFAASIGWLPIVHKFVKDPAESKNMNVQDQYGWTPVNLAIHEGHWRIVQELFKYGASIDLQVLKGHEDLIKIAQHDQTGIVKHILSSLLTSLIRKSVGTDKLEQVSVAASTMFCLLHPNRLGFLGENATSSDKILFNHLLLLDAIVRGDMEMIKDLLTGVDFDFKKKPSFFCISAMFLAVELDRAPAVELLLRKGANVNMKGPGRCTPLHRAVYRNHVNIVKALLKERADLDLKDDSGWTVWKSSLHLGHREVTLLLQNAGADPSLGLGKLSINVYPPSILGSETSDGEYYTTSPVSTSSPSSLKSKTPRLLPTLQSYGEYADVIVQEPEEEFSHEENPSENGEDDEHGAEFGNQEQRVGQANPKNQGQPSNPRQPRSQGTVNDKREPGTIPPIKAKLPSRSLDSYLRRGTKGSSIYGQHERRRSILKKQMKECKKSATEILFRSRQERSIVALVSYVNSTMGPNRIERVD